MSSATTDAPRLSAPPVPATAGQHEGAARAFWRVLTRFDSAKVSPHLALRNSIGVLLPLVAGFTLNMPRGGVVVASGALNVAYSDGSDPYAQRAKRMLSSRSEEHTSELQSPCNLVCRLLLEKKKNNLL